MIENRRFALSIRRNQDPHPRTWHVVPHLVPQRFQNRHQFVPGDQTRMNQEQVIFPIHQIGGDLGSRQPARCSKFDQS